jgi:hypothetical protein
VDKKTQINGWYIVAAVLAISSLLPSGAVEQQDGFALLLGAIIMLGRAIGHYFGPLGVEIVGVQRALLINGALAVGVDLIIGRAWIARKKRPSTPSRSP